MTLSKFYERLLERGYENLIIEKHLKDRGHWDVTCGAVVRDHLELDRRKVFQTWYGTELKTLASGVPEWSRKLWIASTQYASATIPSCIEYILHDD